MHTFTSMIKTDLPKSASYSLRSINHIVNIGFQHTELKYFNQPLFWLKKNSQTQELPHFVLSSSADSRTSYSLPKWNKASFPKMGFVLFHISLSHSLSFFHSVISPFVWFQLNPTVLLRSFFLTACLQASFDQFYCHKSLANKRHPCHSSGASGSNSLCCADTNRGLHSYGVNA